MLNFLFYESMVIHVYLAEFYSSLRLLILHLYDRHPMHETNVLRMYDPSTYCDVLSIETNNYFSFPIWMLNTVVQ